MTTKQDWQAQKIHLSVAIISCAATLVIGVFIGLNWAKFTNQFLPYLGFQKESTVNWSELDEIYNTLAKNYDGAIDRAVLIEGAKKGLVEALNDTYTVYMTASEASDFKKSLHGDVGAGIGIEMALRDNYVRVIRTLPDNPARAAGILSGDIIYKVNNEEVYSFTAEKIAEKIRGEAGSTVTVTMIRNGEEKTFKMTREKINNVSADIEYDGSTAIIRVTRFDNDTGTIVQEFAKQFSEKGVDKVILDLRGNGGGYVSAAQDLLSLWIDGQKILEQKSTHTGINTTFAKHGQAILANTKTIVLINSTTASASEITAGALKDYNKATIIGEKTFGKGVVQTLLDLKDDALLKVTTARWYTPKGNSIDKSGITPDIEVINTYDDINAGRDPQLDAAKAK